MIQIGSILTLDIEKPTAGGRMLARHHGQGVLVWGAVPGERVAARVERTTKSVAFASTIDVLSASPDRRTVGADPRCGGNVLVVQRQVFLRFSQIAVDLLHAVIKRIPWCFKIII
jgi:predicted RNA-binding protein with TRAM domain